MTFMVLDRESIVGAAIESTGLQDFGGSEWIEGLDRFIESLRAEADLHELGHVVAESQITTSLTTRLRVIDWHNRHPEVAETPVAAPIVIVGQPRTGTTILFDLLAQDPNFRVPLTWEVSAPIPPPEPETYWSDSRIAESEAAAQMTEAIIPGFQAIHPSGAQRAQECVAITAGDFRSLLWPTVFNVPSYTKWLLYEADMTSAYRYHGQFLQVLQSKMPGERWLLKTPGHLWHLEALFAAYPDATIIQTHRDPLKVLSSLASLLSVLQKMGTDDPQIPELASQWAEYLFDGNDRAIADRHNGTVAAGRAIDIRFDDLMSDTFGSIGGIYGQLGLELTPGTEQTMRDFLADNSRDKHGSHVYSFADTKLVESDLRARTKAYETFFAVPNESL